MVKSLGVMPWRRGSVSDDVERNISPSVEAVPMSSAIRSWSTESPLTSTTPEVTGSTCVEIVSDAASRCAPGVPCARATELPSMASAATKTCVRREDGRIKERKD
jgi:hypothetical protein